jgi:two-component system phosphate regulon sensor histidine kinase PhoR
LEARVTIISADGAVLGDSTLDGAGLTSVENHASRPEILAARRDGIGVSRRRSATTDVETMYRAVRLMETPEASFVRVGFPLRELDAAIWNLRLLLVIGGLFTLGVAVLAGSILSRYVTRTLRDLLSTARTMQEGHFSRMAVPTEDELGGIALSFNRMAEALERTMATLADERDRFETVLESMDEAVLAVDREGRINTLNRAARSILGVTEGAKVKQLDALDVPPQLTAIIADARLGRPQSTELEVNGGNKRNILARATPQADGGVVVVMHDMTEIRRLETIRRDFVANVSHELRTPVSIIRANAETLLNGALERPDQARRFVEALLRHADRLGRLISDLLDISRIEAGKYPIEPRTLKVAPVVRRIFESVDMRAQTKQMTLLMDIDDDLVLVADAKALEQVLLNLVENAIKYTPERGSIEVHARRDGECVRVEIMDDGPGIDPIHRPRIFERFYRVDPGRSREMGGTGLGLAIVKHLVEAMRGRVGVDGRTPSGSVFWVVMPGHE